MRSPQAPIEPSCAFCGKGQREVTQLVTGPTASICDACVAVCIRILAGTLPGHTDWKEVPNDMLLGALKPTAASVDAARKTLGARIDVLRRRGVSWTTIGGALGISRQAAWERFSRED